MAKYKGFKMVGDSTLRASFELSVPRYERGDKNWDGTWDYEPDTEDVMTSDEIRDHVRFAPLRKEEPDPVVVEALEYLQATYPQLNN